MIVTVKLVMHNLVVRLPFGLQTVERFEMCWKEELTEEELMRVCNEWVTSSNFLLRRMRGHGLVSVGESDLVLDPTD